MKLSYSWLKDYVDVKIDPKKLAHMLTMAGVNVVSCEKIGGDYIFEFEITANRADCLSVIGIAREVAAILGKKIKLPKELNFGPGPYVNKRLDLVQKRMNLVQKRLNPVHIKSIKDPDLCYRYTGRVIKNVEVKPSPDWLKNRIISVGLRPVNNIVDITNFVLLETGQPMHAFDLDKISGSIKVRRSEKGEKIMTLDSTARTLENDTLVIADDSGPIAIAGVMGGTETEVNDLTKNILLESAFFNPISVRRTSRALGLSSESSYRFERRIDNSMVLKASERGSALIKLFAGGNIAGLVDIGSRKAYSKTITVDPETVSKLLGTPISSSKQKQILKTLGFDVAETKKSLKITVPSFREDVKKDVDIIEEVARVYGYEKIPVTIPKITENTAIKSPSDVLKENIADILTRLGLNEIITYSLISKNSIKNLGVPEDEIIAIKNPLSIDQEIMRPTALPGMLSVISHNLNRKAKGIAFFEIGKIYRELSGAYSEEPILSIGLSGIKSENWKTGEEKFTFFDLKGIIEKLLKELAIEEALFKKEHAGHYEESVSALLECGGNAVAGFGRVKSAICKDFDIEKEVFYAEIRLKPFFDKAKLYKRYSPYGKYPSILRDISMIIDANVDTHDVVGIIGGMGSELVKTITLADVYKGKQIPQGKRGLLYRIEYRSDERTLEDSEVETIHSGIKTALTDKLKVIYR